MKKLTALFLALALCLSLCTVTAFAEGHDLTVTKADGSDATKGTTYDSSDGADYFWLTSGDYPCLIIFKSGLTVSGETTSEHIVVRDSATDLTIKNLKIEHSNTPLAFDGTATLTLVGDNELTCPSGVALRFDKGGTIAGVGNLTASSDSNAGIFAMETLTFTQTGTVTSSGAYGIGGRGDVSFNNGIGKILARGSAAACVSNGGAVTLGDALTMKGSTADDTAEASITDAATIDGSYVKTNGQIALSVLIEGAPTKTIADVLNTVDGGFPTTTTSTPPANAWTDGNGHTAYMDKYNFINTGIFNANSTCTVKSEGDNYVFETSLSSQSITFTAKLTFYMENGVLTSIDCVATGYYEAATGTYTAPAPTYTVTVDNNITHGTVTATPTADIASGTDVTLTVTPNAGYQLKEGTLKVNGSTDGITDKGAGKYEFTMPAANVTVTAEFEVTNITLNYEKLSIDQIKGLKSSDKMADIITITSPESLNSLIMENASCVNCYDAEGNFLFLYDFSSHGWMANMRTWDVDTLDFTKVAKVGYKTRIGASDIPVNFNTVSGTITANGINLPVDDYNRAISCFYKFPAGDAVWINVVYDVTYTVTLDMQGGTGGSGSVTATYGEAMPSATMPTKAGYTFNGYFDAASGGTKYYNANGTSAKNWDKTDAAVTLYAQWTEVPHSFGGGSIPTVTVPVSGDSNSVKVEASVSGSTATVKQIKDADLAKVTGGESVAIDLSGVGKNVDTAKIPTQTVEKIAEKSAMTVKLPVATVEFDKAATEEIADQAKGSNIELVVDDIKEVSLNAVQKETVKKLDTAIIIDAHLASNGSRLCTAENGGFGSGKAKVILPYEIKNNRTAANYSVFYVDDAGKLQKLNAKYDEELAAFVFEIEHFSVYAVAYDEYVMPFVDVAAGEYFYDAVKWAAANAITSGTDATHFNPLGITSRGQMVTFLWRAAGEPEPAATSCKFTDVKADAYYYKAVLWAVEKGITDGTSETTFSPDMNVSRAQAVTFLARMSGVKDDAAGYTHKFADVKATAYYNNAVAWAYENKITDGTSETTFSPNDDCLRNQIVCFLYRYFVK